MRCVLIRLKCDDPLCHVSMRHVSKKEECMLGMHPIEFCIEATHGLYLSIICAA